jgi:hypothetical protein
MNAWVAQGGWGKISMQYDDYTTALSTHKRELYELGATPAPLENHVEYEPRCQSETGRNLRREARICSD